MCHSDETWTEALRLVLGIRTAYKGLQSSAELVYGQLLRVSGELLVSTSSKVKASIFIQQLRRLMDQLRPAPAACHASPATYVHNDLRDSTHIFLRQDTKPAPWSHRTVSRTVIARTEKALQIVRGRQVTISADRVKPAYILEGTQHDTGSLPAQPRSAPTKPVVPTQSPKTTHSGRTVRFPDHFTPKYFSARGGGVMWKHPHESTSPSSIQFSVFLRSSPLTSPRSTHQIHLQLFLRVPHSSSPSLTSVSALHSKTEHRFPSKRCLDDANKTAGFRVPASRY